MKFPNQEISGWGKIKENIFLQGQKALSGYTSQNMNATFGAKNKNKNSIWKIQIALRLNNIVWKHTVSSLKDFSNVCLTEEKSQIWTRSWIVTTLPSWNEPFILPRLEQRFLVSYNNLLFKEIEAAKKNQKPPTGNAPKPKEINSMLSMQKVPVSNSGISRTKIFVWDSANGPT